jgi:hypothetical protein
VVRGCGVKTLIIVVILMGGAIMSEASLPSELVKRIPDADRAILARVAKEYKLDSQQTVLLHAIRVIENGRNGLEMGVGDGIPDHPARRFAGDHAKSLETQARWAAGTVSKRFTGDMKAFAQRYCRANWQNWERMARRLTTPDKVIGIRETPSRVRKIGGAR